MRWYSTRESVRAGEPTVLAIVETLLAMAATVAIGVWTGSWWHLAIASCVTPLLLLRTDESCKVGWSAAVWLEPRFRRLRRLLDSRAVYWPLLGVLTIVLALLLKMVVLELGPDLTSMAEYRKRDTIATVSVLVGMVPCFLLSGFILSLFRVLASSALPAFAGRVCGAAVGLWRDPQGSVAAMSGNWWQGIACIDMAHPPSMLPRPDDPAWTPPEHTFAIVMDGWSSISHRRLFKESQSPASEPPGQVMFLPLAAPLPVLVPAIAVRFSLKSTALIWLPLIWAIRPKKPANEPWTAHLKMFGRSDWTKAKAVLSVLTVLAALAKYVLFAAEANIVAELSASASPSVRALAGLLDRFYRPNVIPIWQIVAVFNGVVFLAALFLARHWDLRNQSGLAIDERRINTVMEWLIGVTRLLAPYIIICNLWAAWHLAKKLPMPPVGSELFPWL